MISRAVAALAPIGSVRWSRLASYPNGARVSMNCETRGVTSEFQPNTACVFWPNASLVASCPPSHVEQHVGRNGVGPDPAPPS